MTNKTTWLINKLRIGLLFLLGFSLNACLFAPGLKTESPPISQEASIDAHPIKVHFIPITVALTQSMERSGIYRYHVGAYDVLNVYVWDHPEFHAPLGEGTATSGKNAELTPSLAPSGFLVGPDGNIFFPLLGYVHVAGKTVPEIRAQLTRLLTKYVRNPQVDVRVIEFRSQKIYVMGEVNTPGLQPLTDVPMAVLDALNLAGGMVPDTADPSHIFVIRGNYAGPEVYWLNADAPSRLLLAQNFYLLPQDVIFVSTAPMARWNRAINQVLPSIQTIWFTRSLVTQ